MRKKELMNYIQKNYENENDIEKLNKYIEDNSEMLNKFTRLYPVIDPARGIIAKYIPKFEEYLEFEQKNNLNKFVLNVNRKKYGFPSIENKDINKKTSVINKRDVRKTYNISMEDVKLQAHLFTIMFDTNKECFIRIRCASTKQIYSYNVKVLKDPKKLFNILNSKKFTKEDLFYSLATYTNMKKGEENDIFSLHTIECDIDYIDKKIRRFKDKTPLQVFEILQAEEFGKTIPIPNIVEIGRQLKLFFKIECVGATKPSKNLVKRVNRVFAERLTDYGSDMPRLTDGGRISGSINTKSNDKVEIFFIEDAPMYTLNELRDKWLDVLPEWYSEWKSKPKKVLRLIPKDKDIFYPINKGRIEDFYKISNYFGKDLDGKRFLCFLIRNHAKLAGMSDNEAKETMRDFNNNLIKPLSWRVIERDTRNVNKKQYLYKDITILDYLGLDKEDVELIGLQELKYVTDEEKKIKRKEWLKDYYTEYNYQRYRNDELMTKTEVRRRNEFIQVARLELQGMSLNKIAAELGKAESTIKEKVNKQYKKINYTEIKQLVLFGVFDDVRVEHLA